VGHLPGASMGCGVFLGVQHGVSARAEQHWRGRLWRGLTRDALSVVQNFSEIGQSAAELQQFK